MSDFFLIAYTTNFEYSDEYISTNQARADKDRIPVAKVSILEHRVEEVESVLGARRRHESGKRAVLKDQIVYTLPEIVQAVKDAEKATAKRKKTAHKRIHRRQRIVAREVVP